MVHPEYLWLAPLGLVVGVFGTLIGAGGGFILAPILIMLYPDAGPKTITSISLAAVFANAGSGSIAYARMRRIDYLAGGVFALAAAPGAVLGALTTAVVPRQAFDATMGCLFLVFGAALAIRPTRRSADSGDSAEPEEHLLPPSRGEHGRSILTRGGLLSAAVGYVSSLLGIGGGVIHVPVLSQWLGYPVHMAAATSHFVLALMALTGTVTHVVTGSFHDGWRRALCISVGIVIGAQLGALLSNRVRGAGIIRALAAGLIFAGGRILVAAFHG